MDLEFSKLMAVAKNKT